MHVVVVGAGVAGLSALKSAVSRGAKVTVIENSTFRRPASNWPLLISGELAPESITEPESDFPRGLRDLELRLHETAEGIEAMKKTVRTSRGSVRYDSLVVATGSSPVPISFHGLQKRGAYLLRGVDDFRRLAADLGNISKVVIAGSGPLSLTLAEKLIGKGVKVSLLASRGIMSGYLQESIRSSLEGRLVDSGVEIVRSVLEGVAGVNRVEAALAGGSVIPCDALILPPALRPNPPPIAAEKGGKGGLIVDDRMRTNEKDVYAAGDCAEIRIGQGSLPMMSVASAILMGAIGGENAAGGDITGRPAGLVGRTFFGFELSYAGTTLQEAAASGMDVLEATAASGDNMCAVLFERRTATVRGVQISGRGALALADAVSLIISRELKLQEVAYYEHVDSGGSPSDISPISEAARAGIAMGY